MPAPASQTSYHPPPPAPLDVVYLDDTLLVVNKPSGLLSVPGRGKSKQDSLASRVQREFPEALIVHRLDMETSGLLLLARDPHMQREMSRAFARREVEKAYRAEVIGRLDHVSGIIDLPLICDWPNRPRQMVDQERGKPSLTRYRVIGYDEERDISRVELHPATGRTHQLRVHLQALGHPILGDALYADETARAGADRLLLHATRLAFIHPQSREPLLLESKPPF
ncbi:MAG: pseudouridine synthase [Acidithiobacillales bacterium SG8_45]|jgi:tRNA pseudouridine32 synthase/23S rRNA pseudouridine746 synthase|nr:MAG: pseudouridine synthase [Acidithiobacillales bacterium SG8_45]